MTAVEQNQIALLNARCASIESDVKAIFNAIAGIKELLAGHAGAEAARSQLADTSWRRLLWLTGIITAIVSAAIGASVAIYLHYH